MLRRLRACIPHFTLASMSGTAPVTSIGVPPSMRLKSTGSSDGDEGSSKVKIIRNLKLLTVLEQISNNDVVLMRQESPQVSSFTGFKNAKPEEVARRILKMDMERRHWHVVWGREGVPSDLILDLDFGHCSETAKGKKKYTGESVLLTALEQIDEQFRAKKVDPTQAEVIVLDGNSKQKHSFHVHVRHPKVAFQDTAAMRDFAATINGFLPMAAIDVGVYRTHSTMRLAYTPKFTEGWRKLLPVTNIQDSELARRLQPMSEMSEEEIMRRSFVNRFNVAPGELKLIKQTGSSKRVELDVNGKPIARHLLEAKKWVRYQEAIASVRRLPSTASESYPIWIRTGIALHSFGPDQHILDEWKRFSSKCQVKYDPGMCDKMWLWFDRIPNHDNWRRGFNYMVHTVNSPRAGGNM